MPLLDNNCWADFYVSRPKQKVPCLFLDRDGVVIIDRHYIKSPDQVEVIAKTIKGAIFAKENGFLVGLVTNQSGIGRGLVNWEDFISVQRKVTLELAELGLSLDFVCACPFHPDALAPYQEANHPWRKPNPGMLLFAKDILNIDMERSIMVGDKETDLLAGFSAGLSNCILFNGTAYEHKSIGNNDDSMELNLILEGIITSNLKPRHQPLL